MIPEHVAQRLERLYDLRARVDAEIKQHEADLRALQRRKAGGARQRRRQWIEHGTNAGYQWHLRHGVPFPEDGGSRDCRCREAHAVYVARATRQRNAVRRLERMASA